MARSTTYLLVLFVIFAFCLSNNGVYAFGAGNIPSYASRMSVDYSLILTRAPRFAYMEGRAFRHGDIVRSFVPNTRVS